MLHEIKADNKDYRDGLEGEDGDQINNQIRIQYSQILQSLINQCVSSASKLPLYILSNNTNTESTMQK